MIVIIEYLCTTEDITKLKLKENELLEFFWVKESDIDSIEIREIVKEILKKCFNIIKLSKK